MVDAAELKVQSGERATVKMRLSSAPADVLAVQAELQGGSGLSIVNQGLLFYSPDNWAQQQDVVISAKEVKQSTDATLVLSASGLEPVNISIQVENISTPPPEQVVGGLNPWLLWILAFVSGLVRWRNYRSQNQNEEKPCA